VAQAGPVAELDESSLERSLGEQLRRYDKGGDQFYDTISALHKSVRGSDPDAAMYWLARMLDGGVDPRYIIRRVVRMASEDIGNADPRALRIALDAAETFERLGSPEGELALAQAVVYLAVAPKSNAVYTAWKAVRAFVAQDGTRPIPIHLRNAPTKLMKNLGYGRAYRYAHDEPGAFAAGESYWPDGSRRRPSTSRCRAGWNCASARSSPSCVGSTRPRGRQNPRRTRRPTPSAEVAGARHGTRLACRGRRRLGARPVFLEHGRSSLQMDIFVQQIINGLVLGSMYALVALGYTMVYGIISLINFAHGEVLMVGAMVSWSVVTALADSGCRAGRCC
jgi:hypothetical protein